MIKILLNKFLPSTSENVKIPTVYEYKEYRTKIKDLNAHGNIVKDDNNFVQVFKKLHSEQALSLVDIVQAIKTEMPKFQNSILVMLEVVDKKTRFFFCNMTQPYVQENLVTFESNEDFYHQDLQKISYLITLYLFTTQSLLLMPLSNGKSNKTYEYFTHEIIKMADAKNATVNILSSSDCKKILGGLKIIESGTNSIVRKVVGTLLFVIPLVVSQAGLNFFETKLINEVSPKIENEKKNAEKLKKELTQQAGKIAEAEEFLRQKLRVCQ